MFSVSDLVHHDGVTVESRAPSTFATPAAAAQACTSAIDDSLTPITADEYAPSAQIDGLDIALLSSSVSDCYSPAVAQSASVSLLVRRLPSARPSPAFGSSVACLRLVRCLPSSLLVRRLGSLRLRSSVV